MALIVIGLGVPVSLLFQVFIHEDPNARPPKLKWYKWLINPEFYLVSVAFNQRILEGTQLVVCALAKL